jgi:hypothetical protein
VDGRKLITGCGDRVCVIYPGRENLDRGPDFLGAVIATADQGIVKGDVELHLRASDWRGHGHHRDPRFNRVVLHVAWVGAAPAELQNGSTAPTLQLRQCLNGSLEDVRYWSYLPVAPGEICRDAAQRLGGDELGLLLDEVGERRFRLAAERFASGMSTEAPSEVLYRGIMGALGYSKNTPAFETLARRLPYARLQEYGSDRPEAERPRVLAALLLGKAGLLDCTGSAELERIWARSGEGAAMSRSRWRLFRVRPGNHPARRLVGAAHLLARFADSGLLEGLLGLISAGPISLETIERSFVVEAPGGGGGQDQNLIGWGRAGEILVNVVLPCVFGWAQARGRQDLADAALTLYRGCPKASEYGITRKLQTLLGAHGLVSSARRQQGLIHLEKSFCRQGDCMLCPVAQRLES